MITVQHAAFAEQCHNQRLQLAELRLQVDAFTSELVDVAFALVRTLSQDPTLLLIKRYVLAYNINRSTAVEIITVSHH